MVYFLITIVTIYYLNSKTNHGEKIEVPSYLGKNIKQVSADLDLLNLSYEVVDSIYDPEKKEGTILYQDPMPTKLSDVYVKEGRKIRFRVSKKTKLIEIPLLIDRSERFAQTVLKNLGVNVVVSYSPSQEAAGAILDQKYKNRSMKDGDKIPIGSTIYIVVGQSVMQASMPSMDFNCLTINQVKERFSTYPGITLNAIFENCHTKEDTLNARVYAQNPAFEEGLMIGSGAGITLNFGLNTCK
jgi:beta-lactam-binding protein with PASTA domain